MLQVCVIRGRGKKSAIFVSHTHTHETWTRVILDTAGREQEDSDMEMKINLDMSSLLCLLLSLCFLLALLFLSRHFYSVFLFCFFQRFLVAEQPKAEAALLFNAPEVTHEDRKSDFSLNVGSSVQQYHFYTFEVF